MVTGNTRVFHADMKFTVRAADARNREPAASADGQQRRFGSSTQPRTP
jgi:hypothetical protein